MRDRYTAAILLFVLAMALAMPTPALANPPQTELESLINAWRVELGVSPLQTDERLYMAAEDVAGDGTACPQDRMFVEFAIAGALYYSGYIDRRGYSLLLCGEYPMAEDVIGWVRQHGGPNHPDLEDFGIVHLTNLDFIRPNGNHVSDIWVLLAADPMN